MVTTTTPLVAPAGSVAVIVVALVTVKPVTATPLTVTAVAPVKPVPLITSVELTHPWVITLVPSLVNWVIVGAETAGVYTNCTFPVVA